ncbi:hypothetical protein UFOVP43_34 [uncultured Caudovirales phage]|uniref:Uncharacterized protein n=1 Tax=uncultured Caudovirales phage TaxID=2100421 RepID=A0A6J5KR14_9CAUD|nr:hypothetical protein UFOVP43_34 [uncultured Caudovirales phage]
MVQNRPAIREQILKALAEGHMSSKEIAAKLKSTLEKTKHVRAEMVKQGLIVEIGSRLNKDGKGTEKIWGLVAERRKAINAFDWRNWETEAHYTVREIAYSPSLFHAKTEKRVIVYSRA